jgi:hypothetical protein
VEQPELPTTGAGDQVKDNRQVAADGVLMIQLAAIHVDGAGAVDHNIDRAPGEELLQGGAVLQIKGYDFRGHPVSRYRSPVLNCDHLMSLPQMLEQGTAQ